MLTDLLDEQWSTGVEDDGSVGFALDGYGYRWLRALSPGDARLP